jgi:hypothetical protein
MLGGEGKGALAIAISVTFSVNMNLPDDDKETYNRWQGFRINQLTLCISLFLTFAVASLGFSINLLIQPRYEIAAYSAKMCFLFSLSLGLISVLLGSVAC